MKSRYAFSLAIAAAISGAAAGYFIRSPDLAPPQKETASAPSISPNSDDRDELLARMMASLCPEDYQPGSRNVRDVIVDRLRAIENAWAEDAKTFRDDSRILRIGPLLRIKTDVRDIEFFDVGYLCDGESLQLYRYKGRITGLQWHVLEFDAYESQSSILVSPKTGERLDLFEKLSVSPSGRRLVASASSYFKGLQIFRTTDDRPVAELEWHEDMPLPSDAPAELRHLRDVIRWIDDETLLLAMEPERMSTSDRQAKLSCLDGRWQLEYFTP